MAKLTARGRTEVWRVQLIRRVPEGGAFRVELALMSDGNLLKKETSFAPDGKKKYDWGWKTFRKLKKDGDPNRLKQNLINKGYEEVRT